MGIAQSICQELTFILHQHVNSANAQGIDSWSQGCNMMPKHLTFHLDCPVLVLRLFYFSR